MDLQGISLFDAISSRMSHLSQKQKVIAENVANSDTPQYEAKTVEEFSFENEMRRPSVGLGQTNDGHMAGTLPERTPVADVIRDPDAGPASPNGNNVVLEEQLAASARTKGAHEKAVKLYTKHRDMIHTVLGGN